MSTITATVPKSPAFNWRAHLRVHPAAELFKLMAEAELRELAEGIKTTFKTTSGLIDPIVIWVNFQENDAHYLLDGRNRLDALALAGLLEVDADGKLCDVVSGNLIKAEYVCSGDPYEIALSLNVHRRHLTVEERRELIAKLLKANPEKSNRQVAEQVKASHPHVAKVRAELEKAGDVETVSTSIDTKGRKQPAKRKAAVGKAIEPEPRAEFANWLDAAEKAHKASAHGLEEFTGACRKWLPKVTEPFHRDKARRLACRMTDLPEAVIGTLDAIVQSQWRDAIRAFETLTSHTPAQVAAAIPPEDGSLVTEIADYFAQLAKCIRPTGNGEAPTAGPGCSIPDNDLSIPAFLQRERAPS